MEVYVYHVHSCLQRQAMVLLSVLSSMELYEEASLPPRITFPYAFINVPADGRCFWSAMFLGVRATPRQIWGWSQRQRSLQGFANEPDSTYEKDMVLEWSMRLVDMPKPCRERLFSGACAISADMALRYKKPNMEGGNVFVYFLVPGLPVGFLTTRVL